MTFHCIRVYLLKESSEIGIKERFPADKGGYKDGSRKRKQQYGYRGDT